MVVSALDAGIPRVLQLFPTLFHRSCSLFQPAQNDKKLLLSWPWLTTCRLLCCNLANGSIKTYLRGVTYMVCVLYAVAENTSCGRRESSKIKSEWNGATRQWVCPFVADMHGKLSSLSSFLLLQVKEEVCKLQQSRCIENSVQFRDWHVWLFTHIQICLEHVQNLLQGNDWCNHKEMDKDWPSYRFPFSDNPLKQYRNWWPGWTTAPFEALHMNFCQQKCSSLLFILKSLLCYSSLEKCKALLFKPK